MNYTYEEYLKKFFPNESKKRKPETPKEFGERWLDSLGEEIRQIVGG